MNNKSAVTMDYKSKLLNQVSCLFGIAVFAIAVVNTFWGNDPGFGVFLLLLSFLYFPPVNVLLKNTIGFAVPGLVKILLGIFTIWASLGVGELFDKIHLMMMDLQ